MTQIFQYVQRAAEYVKSRITNGSAPVVGIILGTGLGEAAAETEIESLVPYEEIPGFPVSTVESHSGRFIFGRLENTPVVMQQGRFHLYEGYEPHQVVMGVRIMAMLGIKTLVVTNAAGALNPRFEAGELMLMTDHINFTGHSPLRGPNAEELGPRFPDMSRPYDQKLADIALNAALKLGIRLEKGVYAGVCGPQMETPAETRFYRMAGADAIGMSTVLEVIAARHMGLSVLGISCLTNKNLPDCMDEAPLEQVIATAAASSKKLTALLRAVLKAASRADAT